MSNVKCSASEFAKVLGNAIKQYSDDVVAELPDAVKEAATVGVKALKANASSAVGGTKYKNSFRKENTGSSSSMTSFTIYSTRYRVAHLLEHGHVIKNKHGVYGVTQARPHWAPAEEEAIKALEDAIEKKIGEA